MPANYIGTANPYGLADPPDWFLQQLAAYDPALRLFASVEEPVYRIGRVAAHTRVTFETDVLQAHADARIFKHHRLLAWKALWPKTNWATVIPGLAEFDTWRYADAGQQLDDVEARAEQALNRSIADEADQRAADMYRTYQLIEGSRTGRGSRPPGAGYRPLPRARATRRGSPYRPLGGQAMWLPSRGSIAVPGSSAARSRAGIVIASS